MADAPFLRIGTRGSPLALAQADLARKSLVAADPELRDSDAFDVVTIKTSGDQLIDKPLADLGGKGLFSKEIDAALIDGRVDLAVHSAKDLETRLAPGTVLCAVLEREDPRDVFISTKAPTLDALEAGSVVGTASLRRQAQILHLRPDLRVAPLRGNVDTRLGKVENGIADAAMLALAGLRRLGREDRATEILGPETILPAVGQGAIALICRAGDDTTAALLSAVNHAPSMNRITAERAMLAALDGSCKTPVAGLAEIGGDGGLTLRALVARPDGAELIETSRQGPTADAEAMGRDAGQELRSRAGPGFFEDEG